MSVKLSNSATIEPSLEIDQIVAPAVVQQQIKLPGTRTLDEFTTAVKDLKHSLVEVAGLVSLVKSDSETEIDSNTLKFISDSVTRAEEILKHSPRSIAIQLCDSWTKRHESDLSNLSLWDPTLSVDVSYIKFHLNDKNASPTQKLDRIAPILNDLIERHLSQYKPAIVAEEAITPTVQNENAQVESVENKEDEPSLFKKAIDAAKAVVAAVGMVGAVVGKVVQPLIMLIPKGEELLQKLMWEVMSRAQDSFKQAPLLGLDFLGSFRKLPGVVLYKLDQTSARLGELSQCCISQEHFDRFDPKTDKFTHLLSAQTGLRKITNNSFIIEDGLAEEFIILKPQGLVLKAGVPVLVGRPVFFDEKFAIPINKDGVEFSYDKNGNLYACSNELTHSKVELTFVVYDPQMPFRGMPKESHAARMAAIRDNADYFLKLPGELPRYEVDLGKTLEAKIKSWRREGQTTKEVVEEVLDYVKNEFDYRNGFKGLLAHVSTGADTEVGRTACAQAGNCYDVNKVAHVILSRLGINSRLHIGFAEPEGEEYLDRGRDVSKKFVDENGDAFAEMLPGIKVQSASVRSSLGHAFLEYYNPALKTWVLADFTPYEKFSDNGPHHIKRLESYAKNHGFRSHDEVQKTLLLEQELYREMNQTWLVRLSTSQNRGTSVYQDTIFASSACAEERHGRGVAYREIYHDPYMLPLGTAKRIFPFEAAASQHRIDSKKQILENTRELKLYVHDAVRNFLQAMPADLRLSLYDSVKEIAKKPDLLTDLAARLDKVEVVPHYETGPRNGRSSGLMVKSSGGKSMPVSKISYTVSSTELAPIIEDLLLASMMGAPRGVKVTFCLDGMLKGVTPYDNDGFGKIAQAKLKEANAAVLDKQHQIHLGIAKRDIIEPLLALASADKGSTEMQSLGSIEGLVEYLASKSGRLDLNAQKIIRRGRREFMSMAQEDKELELMSKQLAKGAVMGSVSKDSTEN